MRDAMTSDELGALFGVSAETIRSLQRRHVLSKVDGKFPVAESVRRAMAHLREQAAARGGKAADGVAAMRAKKLAVEIAALERQEMTARGELMIAADLERDLKKRFREFRDGMLQFPSTIAWLDRETHHRLLERIRELLSDFASGRPYLKIDEANGEAGHDPL